MKGHPFIFDYDEIYETAGGMMKSKVLVIKRKKISNLFMYLNEFFIQIYKNLFSYQMFLVIKPKRSLQLLLSAANEEIAKIKKAA